MGLASCRWRLFFLFAVPAVLAAGIAARASASEPDFGAYWHDGKAEIDGYRLTMDRYGEPRQGTAVAIYVTEPFSESRRVKVNDPAQNPKDTFDVLKLNKKGDQSYLKEIGLE